MTDNTARKLPTLPHDAPPRIVYLHAPIALGTVEDVQGTRALVRMGGESTWLDIDPSVDPALAAEARARRARVVVDRGGEGACSASVVGVLMTARSLEIDRQGNLRAQVKQLVLDAEEALIRTPRSFLRLRERASELFGDELVVRGRLLTRIFGKTIKLN